VIDVTPAGLVLREVAPGVSVADVQAATEPELLVPESPGTIPVEGPRRERPTVEARR
jgi:acyl CoA:acetate/3-ketoacid CoA transferase beta subunit